MKARDIHPLGGLKKPLKITVSMKTEKKQPVKEGKTRQRTKEKIVLSHKLIKHGTDYYNYLRRRSASEGIVTRRVVMLCVCPPSHARRITLGGECAVFSAF